MSLTARGVAYQYGAAASGGLSSMLFGIWTAWPAVSLQALSNGSGGFWLDTSQQSTLVTVVDIGNILSPIPSGYLMDIIGRKKTLLLAALVYLASSICITTATTVAQLYTSRFLVGVAKGMSYAVAPFYIMEIASTEIRGGLSSMFIGLSNLGMVACYTFGAICSYNAINLMTLSIVILFLATFLMVPETPYYYIMHGKTDKALASLMKYRQVQSNQTEKLVKVEQELKEIISSVGRDMESEPRFYDLVSSPGRRKALLIVAMLAIFQRGSGISPILAYSPLFMPRNGRGLSPEYYMIVFSIIMVLGNYIALPLVDIIGRKSLLIISSSSSALVMGGAAVYYYLSDNKIITEEFTWVPYVCLITFAVTFSFGVGFLPSTLKVELYPQNLKRYIGSVSAILMAASTYVINRMFLEVNESYGVYIMFVIFTVTCIISTFFSIFVVFETKGKSFAEIQDILNGDNVQSTYLSSGTSKVL